VTDEPDSRSSAAGEPVTEERAAVTGELPTAQHPTTAADPVDLATQISEPAVRTTAPAAAAPVPGTKPAANTPPAAVPTPPAATRPPIPPPVPPAVETGPQPGLSPIDKVTALVSERPEVGVGGAFAGGILFALILKRLGR
jgi:hypothetical protein